MLSRSLGQDRDNPTYMEALSGRNIDHVRRSKGQQEYSTAVISLGCIKWNIDDVSSKAYMTHDGDYDSNVYTDEILLLMDEWDAEYCMDTPSTFHKIEYYVLKSQSHNPDTPT